MKLVQKNKGMINSFMIKVVSFDLGGTIINTYGHSLIVELANAIDVNKNKIVCIIKKYFMTKRMDIDEAVEIISKELEIKSQKVIKDFIANYCPVTSIYDDVDETLSALKERGYILIAIANHYFINGIYEIKPLGYFSQVFYSFDVGMSKPDKEIFLYVEKKMNCSAQNIVHIGDSFVSDIVGPKKVGWNTILIDRTNKNELNNNSISLQADHIITNLYELLDILE